MLLSTRLRRLRTTKRFELIQRSKVWLPLWRVCCAQCRGVRIRHVPYGNGSCAEKGKASLFLWKSQFVRDSICARCTVSCSIRGENSAAKDVDDRVSSQPEEKELYVIKKSFSGRVSDFIQSLIGNGYDLVAKPHTATWLVLFMIVTMYLTCFVAKPGWMSVRLSIVESPLDSIRLGVILICVFIIVFAANQVGIRTVAHR